MGRDIITYGIFGFNTNARDMLLFRNSPIVLKWFLVSTLEEAKGDKVTSRDTSRIYMAFGDDYEAILSLFL